MTCVPSFINSKQASIKDKDSTKLKHVSAKSGGTWEDRDEEKQTPLRFWEALEKMCPSVSSDTLFYLLFICMFISMRVHVHACVFSHMP